MAINPGYGTPVGGGGGGGGKEIVNLGTYATRAALNTFSMANLAMLFNSTTKQSIALITAGMEVVDWTGPNVPTTYVAADWVSRNAGIQPPRTDDEIRSVAYAGMSSSGSVNLLVAGQTAMIQANVAQGTLTSVTTYSGVSATNNPATVNLATFTTQTTNYLATTNQDGSAPPTDVGLAEWSGNTANSYFMVFVPDTFTFLEIFSSPYDAPLRSHFTVSQTIRLINTVPYTSYVLGPVNMGASVTATARLQEVPV